MRFVSVYCVLLAMIAGCGEKSTTKPDVPRVDAPLKAEHEEAPHELPPVPFHLTEPKAPSSVINGKDVSKLGGELLHGLASANGQQRKYAEAAIYAYWASKQLDAEYYDLACFTAQTGNVEHAMYWLQQAGLKEGIDLRWANDDPDLVSVRNDARWNALRQWLYRCNLYHAKNAKPVTTLVLPAKYDYQSGKELDVVIWLHGMGSNPQNFVDPTDTASIARGLATEMNIAFVGVSGTTIVNKKSFRWAENPEADYQHIMRSLDAVKDRVHMKKGSFITLGFSQGAQTGLEVVTRHPEVFAGAIVLSPGSDREQLDQIGTPSPLLKQRGFVFGCGAKEHPGNLMQMANGVRWVRGAGAPLKDELFAGQRAHTFPDDFEDRFVEWVAFIRNANIGKK